MIEKTISSRDECCFDGRSFDGSRDEFNITYRAVDTKTMTFNLIFKRPDSFRFAARRPLSFVNYLKKKKDENIQGHFPKRRRDVMHRIFCQPLALATDGEP